LRRPRRLNALRNPAVTRHNSQAARSIVTIIIKIYLSIYHETAKTNSTTDVRVSDAEELLYVFK